MGCSIPKRAGALAVVGDRKRAVAGALSGNCRKTARSARTLHAGGIEASELLGIGQREIRCRTGAGIEHACLRIGMTADAGKTVARDRHGISGIVAGGIGGQAVA